ncbi:MAG: hypothetical protein IJV92_03435 [Phascolarctobacterium sp.]|nr:hypothetical protein [Phascolarctobacterium sp.]
MFQPPFKRQKGERPAKNPETIIQGQVRDALRLDGWYVIRHQQGMGSHPGLSDLTAIKDGVTIYVEIKTPRGYQSDKQKKFQHDIELHGGKYIIARSIDDIQPYLTRTMKLF